MSSKSAEKLKTCPQPETLAEFLAGKLPPDQQQSCEQHLENCDPCVETIRDLQVHDTFDDLARDAWIDSPQQEPVEEDTMAVHDIIKRMQSLGDVGAAGQSSLRMSSRDNVDDRAAEVQRLLEPSTNDGMIGRLDRYEIESLLGAGSTGVVYKAIDSQLGRTVAIKILRPSLGEAAKKRFVMEARATALLSHPNVIAIYDVATCGTLAYIAMNWEQGQTLEERLASGSALTVDETKSLATQIGNGLAHAHAQSLIHRDIKPANIWITENLTARILDFGLVRINDEEPHLTCTGLIAGTPCFMSPEQSRGSEMDSRSDLFSLGCLLYQTLTGKLPFRSDNALATLQSIQREQPTPPNELDTEIPTDISDLIMCLLEKSPQRRPPSAEKFVAALGSERKQWPFAVAKYQSGKDEIPTRKSGSGWKAIAALLLISLLGWIGFNFAPQIIRIVTNQGEIVIDTKVDNVKIEVIENGQVVRVVDLATENSIEVRAGQYEIRPLGNANQIEIKNDNLSLSRGETEIVEITRNPKTGVDSNPVGIKAAEQETANEDEPYRISAGDVLGIYVEGVLGKVDSDPPIHYPPAESGLPPAIGFPIQVRHDGTISLPYLEPLSVAGKSIVEIKALIFKAYTSGDEPILKADDSRIFVSQMQTRRSLFASQMRMKMSRMSSTDQSVIGKALLKDPSARGFTTTPFGLVTNSASLPPLDRDTENKPAKVATASQDEPYRISAGDVLGLFVEGVLGQYESDPPIHYPSAESGLPPTIGFPIQVRHDGTISLPIVEPLSVAGKTIVEIKALISKAYKSGDNPVLKEDGRIFVSQIQTQRSRSANDNNRANNRRQGQALNPRGGTSSRPVTNPDINSQEPVFKGKTYQQWLQVALWETNPEILLDAFGGLVQLWDKQDDVQLFDAVAKLRVGLQNKDDMENEHADLTNELLAKLTPQQTVRLLKKDIQADTDLIERYRHGFWRFYHFEDSHECLASVEKLSAAETKTLTEDAIAAMDSIAGMPERKVKFLGKLDEKTDWKFSQSPTAMKMLRELLVQSQDNTSMSDADVYLAEYLPDSAELSKRLTSFLDNWKNIPVDDRQQQMALLGKCLPAMNDEYKKILYPKLIELWTTEIDLRKQKIRIGMFGSPPPLGSITSLDIDILTCLEGAPEYIAPHRKELTDILSTFDANQDYIKFIPRFEKLLGQNTDAKPEK